MHRESEPGGRQHIVSPKERPAKLFLQNLSQTHLEALKDVYTRCRDTLAIGMQTDVSLPALERRARTSGRPLYGIFEEDRLVGVADYSLPNGSCRIADLPGQAQLSLFMMASSRRFDGLGSEALQLLEANICQDPSVRAIGSSVEILNSEALRFWIRMGYEIVSGPDWRLDQVGLFHLIKKIPPAAGRGFLNPENRSSVKKVEAYRLKLKSLQDWEPALRAESGLPGPRGNLELAQAVAWEGTEAQFMHFLSFNSPVTAPTDTPGEFVAVCGVVGLGRLVAEGHSDFLPVLRTLASDVRWRVREGVCMALQWWGGVDLPALLSEMEAWSQGSLLEKRAAIAALCEPRILTKPESAPRLFDILDAVTVAVMEKHAIKNDDLRVLRQALSYCWSVAVAAYPLEGWPRFEHWCDQPDVVIQAVMQENLSKKRLERQNPVRVAELKAKVSNNLIRLRNKHSS